MNTGENDFKTNVGCGSETGLTDLIFDAEEEEQNHFTVKVNIAGFKKPNIPHWFTITERNFDIKKSLPKCLNNTCLFCSCILS